MLKANKIKQILKMLLALAVLSVFMLNFLQLKQKAPETCRYTSRGFSHTAAAVMNVNRTINGGQENSRQEKEGEENSSPVFFLNSGLLFNSMPLPALFTLFTAALFLYAARHIYSRSRGISRRKYYRDWYLKFLNPVQKSILERLDQYDINPVRIIKREGNPCFVLKAEHGFFL